MLDILTDRQWLWLAAGVYLVCAIVGTVALSRGNPHSNRLIYILMVVGYFLQLAGLAVRGRAVGGCPLGNVFEILQFTAWSATTLYLLVGVTFRSSILGFLTALLSALLAFVSLSVPAWDASRRANIFGGNAWIEFHAALALFSYGVFGLLALTSLLLLLRNRSLKTKNTGGWHRALPSIIDLDQIGVRLLSTAVILLAASLAVGAAWWLRDTSSANLPKIAVTVAVWLAAIAALALRLAGRLLTRRFAWTCIILFALALASLAAVESSRFPA